MSLGCPYQAAVPRPDASHPRELGAMQGEHSLGENTEVKARG